MQSSRLAVTDEGKGRITITHPDWDGFAIRSLGPSLRMDGADLVPEMSERIDFTTFARSYTFPGQAVVVLDIEPAEHNGIRLRSSFRNIGSKDVVLNRVVLLGTHPTGKGASFGNRTRDHCPPRSAHSFAIGLCG